MTEFSRSPNAQTEEEITRQLRRATFLVPILTDEMHTSPDSQPGSLTIKQGSLMKMLSCDDDAGAQHLPLFTDWPAIRAWTDQQVSTLVMPAAEAWDFVLSQAHYAGAVVNPGGRALPLTRQFIGNLFGKKSEPQVPGKFVITSEATIQTRRAQAVDTQLAAAIQRTCKKIPHLAVCSLLDARKPETGEIRLIIAVTVDDERMHMDSVAQQFQIMLQQFPSHAPKTDIMSSGGFGRDYAGAEFYIRQAD